MFPPIFRVLKASDDVRAIVGDRIYRHGTAPQPTGQEASVTRPAYITWFVVGPDPQHQLDGRPGADRVPIQIDCWSPADREVVALAKAVRDAIERENQCWTGMPIDGRDRDTNRYRIALQFDWWLLRGAADSI
jgi:hypothetical protein